MLLLGLKCVGRESGENSRSRSGAPGQQRPDGGWAGNPHLESDAYATGETLYALYETGMLAADDAAYRRAADYLLRTQHADGSWHVKSRAVKFQPYFQSGFPYDHDQWISAVGTAWASIALANTVTSMRALKAAR